MDGAITSSIQEEYKKCKMGATVILIKNKETYICISNRSSGQFLKFFLPKLSTPMTLLTVPVV
jgi:hypothetical protein